MTRKLLTILQTFDVTMPGVLLIMQACACKRILSYLPSLQLLYTRTAFITRQLSNYLLSSTISRWQLASSITMCIEYTISIKSIHVNIILLCWMICPTHNNGIKCTKVCYVYTLRSILNCIDTIKVYARLCIMSMIYILNFVSTLLDKQLGVQWVVYI